MDRARAEASFLETWFVPMPAGPRRIRQAELVVAGQMYHRMTVSGAATDIRWETLTLAGDVQLDIPAGARAVYIGTIVYYRHDGKRTTGVQVRDEYAAAMRDLAARRLSGLTPKDVVKRLAAPVAAQAQRPGGAS